VRRVLRDMQEEGMVREVTGKSRSQVFLYHRFVDLLDDGL
jgi:ribosomal protein S25